MKTLLSLNHLLFLFFQDVVVSSDGQFALSASWDGTLRLWDLNTGTTTRQFYGHTKDVLSVAFSVDNRQIISGSRDKVYTKKILWKFLRMKFVGHFLTCFKFTRCF